MIRDQYMRRSWSRLGLSTKDYNDARVPYRRSLQIDDSFFQCLLVILEQRMSIAISDGMISLSIDHTFHGSLS